MESFYPALAKNIKTLVKNYMMLGKNNKMQSKKIPLCWVELA